jgi:hypothetical protein
VQRGSALVLAHSATAEGVLVNFESICCHVAANRSLHGLNLCASVCFGSRTLEMQMLHAQSIMQAQIILPRRALQDKGSSARAAAPFLL